MDSKLDPLFETAIESKSIPGVAAVVLDASGRSLYKKAFGLNNTNESEGLYTTSTQTLMWSTTKLVVCVAALQLVEQGKIALDDYVEKYVPSIANVQIIDGKDSAGKFKFRPQTTKATILHCMTHTAGFTYDFFDQQTLEWRIGAGQEPSQYSARSAMEDYDTPMINDPGKAYCYGINIDYLGFVIESVSGLPLNKYVEKFITGPLGLKDTASHYKEGEPRLVVHLRDDAGNLQPNPALVPATNPEKFGGGHYLISTLDDYSQFLLTVLNKGTHPNSKIKILESETCDRYLFKDMLSQICSPDGVGEVPSSIPILTSTGRLLPGIKLGWSCGFLVNLEDTPYGRKSGSGQWAGLGNLYYWIDPTTGILGLIMTSLLPFLDREILHLFDAMEKAAYGQWHLLQHESKDGGDNCNYRVP